MMRRTFDLICIRTVVLVGALGAFTVPSSYSHAGNAIIFDQFNGPNGTSLSGRAPDTTDLPGGTYVARDYFGQLTTRYDSTTGSPAGSAISDANNLTYISIASN